MVGHQFSFDTPLSLRRFSFEREIVGPLSPVHTDALTGRPQMAHRTRQKPIFYQTTSTTAHTYDEPLGSPHFAFPSPREYEPVTPGRQTMKCFIPQNQPLQPLSVRESIRSSTLLSSADGRRVVVHQPSGAPQSVSSFYFVVPSPESPMKTPSVPPIRQKFSVTHHFKAFDAPAISLALPLSFAENSSIKTDYMTKEERKARRFDAKFSGPQHVSTPRRYREADRGSKTARAYNSRSVCHPERSWRHERCTRRSKSTLPRSHGYSQKTKIIREKEYHPYFLPMGGHWCPGYMPMGMPCGLGTGAALGVGTGAGMGLGTGAGMGLGTGAGMGLGTGAGMGLGTGAGMGLGTGAGMGLVASGALQSGGGIVSTSEADDHDESTTVVKRRKVTTTTELFADSDDERTPRETTVAATEERSFSKTTALGSKTKTRGRSAATAFSQRDGAVSDGLREIDSKPDAHRTVDHDRKWLDLREDLLRQSERQAKLAADELSKIETRHREERAAADSASRREREQVRDWLERMGEHWTNLMRELRDAMLARGNESMSRKLDDEAQKEIERKLNEEKKRLEKMLKEEMKAREKLEAARAAELAAAQKKWEDEMSRTKNDLRDKLRGLEDEMGKRGADVNEELLRQIEAMSKLAAEEAAKTEARHREERDGKDRELQRERDQFKDWLDGLTASRDEWATLANDLKEKMSTENETDSLEQRLAQQIKAEEARLQEKLKKELEDRLKDQVEDRITKEEADARSKAALKQAQDKLKQEHDEKIKKLMQQAKDNQEAAEKALRDKLEADLQDAKSAKEELQRKVLDLEDEMRKPGALDQSEIEKRIAEANAALQKQLQEENATELEDRLAEERRRVEDSLREAAERRLQDMAKEEERLKDAMAMAAKHAEDIEEQFAKAVEERRLSDLRHQEEINELKQKEKARPAMRDAEGAQTDALEDHKICQTDLSMMGERQVHDVPESQAREVSVVDSKASDVGDRELISVDSVSDGSVAKSDSEEQREKESRGGVSSQNLSTDEIHSEKSDVDVENVAPSEHPEPEPQFSESDTGRKASISSETAGSCSDTSAVDNEIVLKRLEADSVGGVSSENQSTHEIHSEKSDVDVENVAPPEHPEPEPQFSESDTGHIESLSSVTAGSCSDTSAVDNKSVDLQREVDSFGGVSSQNQSTHEIHSDESDQEEEEVNVPLSGSQRQEPLVSVTISREVSHGSASSGNYSDLSAVDNESIHHKKHMELFDCGGVSPEDIFTDKEGSGQSSEEGESVEAPPKHLTDGSVGGRESSINDERRLSAFSHVSSDSQLDQGHQPEVKRPAQPAPSTADETSGLNTPEDDLRKEAPEPWDDSLNKSSQTETNILKRFIKEMFQKADAGVQTKHGAKAAEKMDEERVSLEAAIQTDTKDNPLVHFHEVDRGVAALRCREYEFDYETETGEGTVAKEFGLEHYSHHDHNHHHYHMWEHLHNHMLLFEHEGTSLKYPSNARSQLSSHEAKRRLHPVDSEGNDMTASEKRGILKHGKNGVAVGVAPPSDSGRSSEDELHLAKFSMANEDGEAGDETTAMGRKLRAECEAVFEEGGGPSSELEESGIEEEDSFAEEDVDDDEVTYSCGRRISLSVVKGSDPDMNFRIFECPHHHPFRRVRVAQAERRNARECTLALIDVYRNAHGKEELFFQVLLQHGWPWERQLAVHKMLLCCTTIGMCDVPNGLPALPKQAYSTFKNTISPAHLHNYMSRVMRNVVCDFVGQPIKAFWWHCADTGVFADGAVVIVNLTTGRMLVYPNTARTLASACTALGNMFDVLVANLETFKTMDIPHSRLGLFPSAESDMETLVLDSERPSRITHSTMRRQLRKWAHSRNIDQRGTNLRLTCPGQRRGQPTNCAYSIGIGREGELDDGLKIPTVRIQLHTSDPFSPLPKGVARCMTEFTPARADWDAVAFAFVCAEWFAHKLYEIQFTHNKQEISGGSSRVPRSRSPASTTTPKSKSPSLHSIPKPAEKDSTKKIRPLQRPLKRDLTM